MGGIEDIEKIEEHEIADISGTVDAPPEEKSEADKEIAAPKKTREEKKRQKSQIQISRFPFLMFLIILIGLAIRIAILVTEKKVYVDGVHYLLQADNMRNGIWDTWDPNGGRWTVPPLYPLMVAFSRFFINDLMRAGQVVSLVASITIIPAVYLIAKNFLGKKGGLWAAFIVAIDPLASHYSILTYAEPMFLAMVAWCIWFSVLTIEKNEKIHPPILMGVFAALAYLTKAFGLALAIWGFVILLYNALKAREIKTNIGLRNLGIYSAAFVVISIPYWIFLFSYLGHWAPDGKSQFEFTRLHAPNIKLESIDPRYEGIITEDYEYKIYDGEPQFGRLHGAEFARTYVKKYFDKLAEIFLNYPVKQVPPFVNVRLTSTLLLIVFGVGLFAVPITLSSSSASRVLLSWFPLWLFIAPLGFIEVRYFVPMTIAMIPFVANGMYHLEDWLKNTLVFKPHSIRPLVVSFMVLILLLNSYPAYSYRISHLNDVESIYWEYKVAGDFMKEYTGGEGGNIIESADMIAFYAGMQGWVTPQTDYDGLISFMKKHEIRFFAMDEYLTIKKHQRPGLKWLFAFPPVETNDLKPIYWDEQYLGHRVIIYELTANN